MHGDNIPKYSDTSDSDDDTIPLFFEKLSYMLLSMSETARLNTTLPRAEKKQGTLDRLKQTHKDINAVKDSFETLVSAFQYHTLKALLNYKIGSPETDKEMISMLLRFIEYQAK